MSEFYAQSAGAAWRDAIVEAGVTVVAPWAVPLQRVLKASAARQAEATGEVIHQVATDVGVELFERVVEENPRVRSLMLHAIDSCLRTGSDSKRRLLAEALTDAIRDEQKIDASWVLTEVLREIDVPHVHALQRLRAVDDKGAKSASAEVKWDGREYVREWNALVQPVRATLVRTGLANETSPLLGFSSEPVARLTSYGKFLLERLEWHAQFLPQK